MIRLHSILISLFLLFFYYVAGAQELVVIQSAHLHMNDSVYVFTPKDYQTGDTCPTLYLLHGFGGNYKDWSGKTDLQALADQYGFIIICPDGFSNGWYVNSNNPRGPQWRSFFERELYPQMQSAYFIHPDRCFITGLSMGGHGAVNIFIDNPDRFRAAGTMSGVMDLHHTPLRDKYISELLGEYSASNARFYTESAINRLELLGETDKLIVINCGYDDYYAFSSKLFADKCRELKIPFIQTMSPGDHSWTFWTFAIKKQLDIFAQLVKGENMGY